MSTKLFRHASRLSVACALAVMSSLAHADPSNKWRVEFNHSSDNDGEIVFRVSPVGGTPIDVATKIPKGTGENHVAQLVKKSLNAKLGKGYHVEVDDFEAVLLQKQGDTPNFDLVIASNSVSGIAVDLKRE
jgi:hypothetical protein